MNSCRRLALAAFVAAVATSPFVAARSPRCRTGSLTRKSSDFIPRASVDAPQTLGVDVYIPRGGKFESVRPVSSFVSQSGSILMGLLLALNSGFINGCALSGAITAEGRSQAVAAVTASWTNSALALAGGNAAKFGFFAKVVGSFMFGSLIAGFMEPTPSQFLVSSSAYGGPLTIAAGLVLIATAFLDDIDKVNLGFYLLSAANGINNSVTSTMTSNLCRTSHFTGISSDMGTFIGQILRGNKTNAFKLKVFAGLAAAFWSGGYLSYGLTKAHGTSILYVSAAVYLFMAFGYDKVLSLGWFTRQHLWQRA